MEAKAQYIEIPSQERAKRTRAALLRVAEEIVERENTAAVTTTRVAAVAGVSVGAVYRYFSNREALLLGAYDATVERVVEHCATGLTELDPSLSLEDAAHAALGIYLDAAEAIPTHAPLLREMRSLRPIADDQTPNDDHIAAEILRPFVERYVRPGAQPNLAGLLVLDALLATLVDLYLVTENPELRADIRKELEAHALLALKRL